MNKGVLSSTPKSMYKYTFYLCLYPEKWPNLIFFARIELDFVKSEVLRNEALIHIKWQKVSEYPSFLK